MRRKAIIMLVLAATIMVVLQAHASAPTGDSMKAKKQLAKFARVTIAVDPKLLDARQRKLVRELVAAARLMDEIFLRQVSQENPALRTQLAKVRKESPELVDYFEINFGPWDRLDHDRPFIDDVGEKPAGAGFYPADITKEELTSWIKAHPKKREVLESAFTVIRRKGKNLMAIPYAEAYQEFLVPAVARLRRAAELTDNASLARYLRSRADAFLTNEYYDSDVDWVRLRDHAIEVVIGPYEVYEDNLMGLKAGFEAFVTRVDPVETERLSKVQIYLPALERQLPIPDQYKGIGRSLDSPIVVAQLIAAGGEARAGIQTLAFNLPNDERVRERFGSKKVLLKNVQEAKFQKILSPIAGIVLRPKDAANVDFEAFFAHTLLHEISHGIGPGKIRKLGRVTTVSKELKELYSIVEECKADVLGVSSALFLAEQGLYPADFAERVWPTYLAGLFRSTRFGIKEAHGGGNAIQFAWLLEKGGIVRDAGGRFGIDRARIDKALTQLAREVLMIEAKGDYGALKKFIAKYRVMRPEMAAAIEKLKDVPVDIQPIYVSK